MEQYDVRIFPTAQQDLMDVIDYLNTLSKEAALNFYDRLVSEIASLSTMPERCPRPRDLALAAKGYRFFLDSPTNQIFIVFSNEQLAALEGKAKFGFWEKFDDTHTVMRIATSWATRMEEIDGLLALL